MAGKPGRGRRSKLTPEIQRQLCAVVELCNSLEDAAAQVGVHVATVMAWAAKGREQQSGIYRDFHEAIEAAKARRRVNFNTTILKHGTKHWQAIAWLAERTDPKRFGLRIRVHVNEELEQMLDKLQRRLTPSEYERALEALSSPDDSAEAARADSSEQAAGGPGFAAGLGAAIESALSGTEALEGADGPD